MPVLADGYRLFHCTVVCTSVGIVHCMFSLALYGIHGVFGRFVRVLMCRLRAQLSGACVGRGKGGG